MPWLSSTVHVAKVTAEQLAKLQQKADQHIARLQAAKARLAETERKLDTRRKIIAGRRTLFGGICGATDF